MKKAFLVLFAALSVLIASYSVSIATGTPDRIVAIVGREMILASQIEEQALMYRLQYPEAKREPGLGKRIMENMINQKILLTKAKIDSVSVDENSIDNMAASRYNSLRSGFPSVSAMEARFGLPVNRLKQDIREDIRNQTMIDAFRRKNFRDVTVSYDETMAFWNREKGALPDVPETVSVSQIVKYPEITAAEKSAALNKIKSIREQLAKGGDFSKLARQYSDDPGSRQVGGDLGVVQRGELVPSFEKAAFALKPGQVSDIVESRFGYHLIQLIDKEESRIHTRHILARFDRSKSDLPGTLRSLESIRADILSGKASFAAMAEKYSDDPMAIRNGGLVVAASTGEPTVEVTALRPELKKVVDGLKKVGDISRPELMQAEKGEPYYIMMRLNSRTPAHSLNPEHDFTRLEELAMSRKRQELFEKWIESLKKEVDVRIMSDI